MTRGDSPIEDYLDELFLASRSSTPRDARHLLVEAEAHLRDAATAAARDGMSELEAEEDAVRRFGAPSRLARSDRYRSIGDVLRGSAFSALQLASVGGIAVGVSGVVVQLLRVAGVPLRVLGGPVDLGLTSAGPPIASSVTCPGWLAVDPRSRACLIPAVASLLDRLVATRMLVGTAGLLVLAALLFFRRRQRRLGTWAPLPALITDSIATTAFAVASLALVALGASSLADGGFGALQWLSAAPIALVAACWYGLRLLGDLGASRGHPLTREGRPLATDGG